MPAFEPPADFSPTLRISVLIPARNERKHLPACIRSLANVNYPPHLLEIIVLDDFSAPEEDPRVFWTDLNRQFPGDIKLLRLEDHLPPEARFSANKKQAITWGVGQASGEIIVTTDADCIVPPEWLRCIAAVFETTDARMVCAPVLFFREKNVFQRFQSLDFAGMAGIAGAGIALGRHAMANGANLSYRRTLFYDAGAYAGNEHIASGDDMFLAQKVFNRRPQDVLFLKNRGAVVQTEAAPDLGAFWNQRLRWGTKNAAFPNWHLRFSLLITGAFCVVILTNIPVCFFAPDMGHVLGIQLLIKAIVDVLFLSSVCRFFGRDDLMRSFVPSFFLHIAYIGIVGLASLLVKKYTWKGRQTG